jgi:hypothetical protein
MKKMFVSLFVFFILTFIFLTGCNGNKGSGLTGEDSDFFGTWKTNTGSGSFTLGDSIRFNSDYTCDYFWSGGYQITASGTWVRHDMYNKTQSAVVITLGEKETVYYYGFFDKYQQLVLRVDGFNDEIFYRKQ